MSTTTTNYGLVKPQTTDNADLTVFVGQNMDSIDSLLKARAQLDGNGSYNNTSNSCFAVTAAVDQSETAGAITKLVFGTKQWDNLSEWDATNNRFTCKAAGIYYFSACMRLNNTTATQVFLAFYKNGAADTRVQNFMNGAGSGTTTAPVHAHGSCILKLAAGDYVEVYGYSSVAATIQSRTSITGYDVTFFRGVKIA